MGTPISEMQPTRRVQRRVSGERRGEHGIPAFRTRRRPSTYRHRQHLARNEGGHEVVLVGRLWADEATEAGKPTYAHAPKSL